MTRLIAALLLFASFACAAQERKYAVLSLIGDRMLVVQYVPMIGGRIDRNTRDYIDLEDPILDKTALLATDQALKRADASAKPVLLFAREKALYEASGKFADGGEHSAKLLALIRPLVQNSGATHLLLFTKVRSEARMPLYDLTVGTGTIDGIGFYVDPTVATKLPDTGESAQGFVGAFAYFQVSLIDLAKGVVVGEQRVLASRTQTAPAAKATDIWTGIPAQEKMRLLQTLVRDEVSNVVPKVAAPR